MNEQDLALAAYLAARILSGHPVISDDVSRLQNANISLNQTRQHLPQGRGNVSEDLDRTGGEARWRADAARNFVPELDRFRGTPRDDYRGLTINQAASAVTFGAGRCGEYSAVSAVLHSERLDTREDLHIVTAVSHQWAEARLGSERERAIVLDGWADGPPVFASDSRFASRNAASLRSYVPIPDAEGMAARNELHETASQVQGALGEDGMRQKINAAARFTARAAAWIDNLLGLLDTHPPHVLNPAFVRGVQDLMRQDPLSAEIAAARAAQQLGRSVETQRDDMQAILGAMALLPH